MRHTKLTYLLLISILIIFFSSIVFSQDGTEISGEPILNNSIENIEEPEIFYPDNVTIPNSPMEYGSNHYNYNLTGTGPTTNVAIIPHSTSFGQSADGTIEMWINPTSLTQTAELIGKGSNSTVQFLLGISSTYNYRLFFRIGSVAFVNSDGDSIRPNVWTHVAVAWTKPHIDSFTVTFYINSIQSGSPVTKAASWASNSDDIWIGGCEAFSTYNLIGKVDEVRIWDPALTQTQIATNRFVGIGTLPDANVSNAITGGAQYAGLISSWTFNESDQVYDYIGGHSGTYNGTTTNEQSIPGQPIPYNLAMYFLGSDSNYVSIPDNTIFEQSGAGSLEAWVYLSDLSSYLNVLSKANAFRFYISKTLSDRLRFRINGLDFSNSDGVKLKEGIWQHIAVTWSFSGGDATVDFYVNGKKSGSTVVKAVTWNNNSEPFVIGGSSEYPANNYKGFIDEVRIWDPKLTEAQVQQYMNVSGTQLLGNTNLLGCWDFEGHLRNIDSPTNTDGTLNNGGANNCRFSGYSNENITGIISNTFKAHPTVLFADYLSEGFRKSFPNRIIQDHTTISDTITVPTSGAVSTVQVFVDVLHTYTSDLEISLIAPNGTTRDLTSDNGGTGEHMLTIFDDAATYNITGGQVLAPFSNYIQPEVALGNMGGTDMNGNWILQVYDDSGADTGKVISWGIRLNNSTPVEEDVTGPYEYKLNQNYPNPFNPTTKIEYSIAQAGLVELKIYNLLGEEITTLVNEMQNPGKYTVDFNGINLSSGVYFYRITSGKFTEVKKMILMK